MDNLKNCTRPYHNCNNSCWQTVQIKINSAPILFSSIQFNSFTFEITQWNWELLAVQFLLILINIYNVYMLALLDKNYYATDEMYRK